MNKSDLESLAELRIKEAETLLSFSHFHGAYYLAGYALECALKACIAKKVNQHDFPNKKLAEDSYSHDLSKLVGVAGLKTDLSQREQSDQVFSLNWAVAKDWSERSRYEIGITQAQARDLVAAISDNNNGVLQWLKNYW
ncbi:MAG: HEPN domain-containing protein [Betaproteobacteria bacterium]|nr:HEPN domain-containing protein [Betaproteobacteria bacterium]